MNAAKLSKSERLSRVMKVLRGGGAYTTRDLIRRANVCAVNSIISEIRANGYRVGCKMRMEAGRRVWVYMLMGKIA